MAIELKTDISLPYVDSEDAFEIFATVVDNGQTRLALQVLVDLLIPILNKINELDETVNAIVEALSEEEDVEDEKPSSTLETAPIVEEKIVEDKNPVAEEKKEHETKTEKAAKQKEKPVSQKVEIETENL
jgi:outer membrane biosynthesis protein TonB